MSKSYRATSPAEFPEPHRFGTWNGFVFRIYPNLSQIKSAITSQSTDWNGLLKSDIKVYEHDGDGWQEIYSLTKGESKQAHELWKNGVAPKTLAVSDSAVDAAIQSILKSGDS